MAQILPNEPNVGQRLAQSLSQLADRKLHQLSLRGGGLTAPQADFVSTLPQQNQWEAAQILSQQNIPQNQNIPERYAQAGIPEQMSGLQEFFEQIQPNNQLGQGNLQATMQQLPQGVPDQLKFSPLENVLRSIEAQRQPAQQQQLQQQLSQAALQQQALNQQDQEAPVQQRIIQQPASVKQAEQKAKYLAAQQPKKAPLGLTKQQQIEQRQLKVLQQKERLQSEKDKADRFKATANIRHAATLAAEDARNEYHDLERLEELSREGKLDTSGYVSFLERSGLDIPALMNPESEEFQKIQQSFLRNAKNYYGGRVSNYEIEQFLKTIPSLSQSPEGRKRVIANLKYINRAKAEHFNTMRDIIKENGGVPPYDLEEQIYEQKSPRLDKLAKLFREDLKKPIPEGQNKFITALQAGAGSILGAPGKILGKAGKVISSVL